MKVTELFSLGANEIKNRLPMATAAKFSTQKIEGKSGKSLLAACISRYNCRIIPIAAIIMIICTFMSVLFENVITDGGSAEIAGEVLILFTAVCGVGFGFYSAENTVILSLCILGTLSDFILYKGHRLYFRGGGTFTDSGNNNGFRRRSRFRTCRIGVLPRNNPRVVYDTL